MTSELNQQLGRAKNSVLSYLEGRLSIPKIYMDAKWDGHPVDLLAINRDGVGDVHVVLLTPFISPSDVGALHELIRSSNEAMDRLDEIPAQFKYIAYVVLQAATDGLLVGVPHPIMDRSLAADGIGKVGFLAVSFFGAGGEPTVELLYKPERFRAKIAKLADEYVQQHEADWEIRA